MEKTMVNLKYELLNQQKTGIPVIIVAAGASTRMEGQNKQMLTLNSIPVIARTLLKFEKCDRIKNIILVSKSEDLFNLQVIAEQYSITKLSDIVQGGKTRQESVLNGLKQLSELDSTVLIHDGARPLVDNDTICRVADALKYNMAVTPAVKVKDTVKEIDGNNKVIKTLKRESLVAVQTPQGVGVEEYKNAILKVGDVSLFTDDTSIMEAAGYEVHIVEGNYKNIKITTPDDVILAENYILGED